MKKIGGGLFILFFVALSCRQKEVALIDNPVYHEYVADPAIVKVKDTFYVYATIDPWGSDELAVLTTRDFVSWQRQKINWPTKSACTSETSLNEMVWAPSVIKANGGYHMYVTVGGEVWVGTSKHPLGPWKNARDDGSPLIRNGKFPGYHMIDAEPFLDDDGQGIFVLGFWNGLETGTLLCSQIAEEHDLF